MKTSPPNRIVLAALSLAMFAVSATATHASDGSNQRETSRVIQLHAPNHTSRTQVVWTRKAATKPSGEASARKTVQPKSIGLPAGNGPVQSLTVWKESSSEAFEIAPLK
jgi:hypothetical protein